MIILSLMFMMVLFVCVLVCGILGYVLPKQEGTVQREHWQQRYRQIAAVGILYGIIFVVCMYKNTQSYTYVICVLAYLLCMKAVFRHLEISMKRENYICGGIMLLAALSTAFTAKWQIHGLNHLLVLMGMMVFTMIGYMDMQGKDLLQWSRYLVLLGCETLVSSVQSLGHIRYWKGNSENKNSNLKYVLIGLVCGIPLVCVIMLLLVSADDVFAAMLRQVLQLSWFGQGILIFLVFLIAFCGFYGLAYGGMKTALRQIPKNEKKGEPVVAITISTMVAVIYLIFCFVQIRYLFLGGIWELPEKFTYARYARQGFFQLLFVSFLNYIMVLLGKYRFRENKTLRRLLLLISVCTYVMMASSFYRMILYVKVYHLTFLRIVVLYFLVGLAVLFALLLSAMYSNKVKLLKSTILTATAFYLVFSFARPDYWVAYYNTTVQQEISSYDWYELTRNLSIDAAPVLWKAVPEEKDEFYENVKQEYKETIEERYEDISLRKFNLSVYLAGQTVKNKE